jgi:hypothetical protein
MQNGCPHILVFRPASDPSVETEIHPTDLVFPVLDEAWKPAFRAKPVPCSADDAPAPIVLGETSVPVVRAGTFVYEAMPEGTGPVFPDGTVLAVSMVTAQALRFGKPRVDPADLEKIFGGRGMRVVVPFTGPGPNCIRRIDGVPSGVPFATRVFEEY